MYLAFLKDALFLPSKMVFKSLVLNPGSYNEDSTDDTGDD